MPADVELGIKVTKRGDGADAVARGLRGAARAADELGDELGKVDRKLVETRLLAAGAAKEFLHSGDISPLRALLRDERELKQVRRSLTGVNDDLRTLAVVGEHAGGTIAGIFTDLSGTVGKGLSKLAASPELAAAGAAIAIPVAAGLAAALAGATLAATAAAGLAGGIVLAARSSEVRQAWSEFGHSALGELQQASVVFVGPLTAAAHTFGDAFRDILPAIRSDFAALAPVVDRLARGAAGLVKAFEPGFSKALQAGVPVLERFADELPRLGHAAGVFFDEISQSSKSGGDALILSVRGVEVAVEGLGMVLHEGATAFELFGGAWLTAMSKLGDEKVLHILTGSPLLQLVDALSGTDDAAKGASQSTGELFHQMIDDAAASKAFAEGSTAAATAMRDGARAAQDLEHQLTALADTIIGQKDAQLAFNKGMIDLKQTLRDNSGALDDHTTKGIADEQALLAQARAASVLRDKVLAQTGSVEAADAAYDASIETIYAAAKAAGVNKEKLDELIGSLRSIPRPNPIDIELKRQGYSDEDLRELKRSLLSAQGTYTIKTVIERDYVNRHIDLYQTGSGGLGRIGGMATGGVIKADRGLSGILAPRSPGTLVLAGEPRTGGEVFAPLRGISRERAMGLAGVIGNAYGFGVGGSGGGGNNYTINVSAAVGSQPAEVGAAVVAAIRAYERSNGTTWRAAA